MVVRAAVGGMGDAAVGMRASGELNRVMLSGRTTIMAEAASEGRLDYPEFAADLGPLVFVPLKAGGRAVGETRKTEAARRYVNVATLS